MEHLIELKRAANEAQAAYHGHKKHGAVMTPAEEVAWDIEETRLLRACSSAGAAYDAALAKHIKSTEGNLTNVE